ncbi:MAG TPA: SDR family NAD(P)-dependent oxidoreductase [Acidobacteriota bacterium]|nr:SDR family NAD(P)-dependent oxidoreductase [Acidobacteriota bacterium]
MLENRQPDVVVITGASAGVGRATAQAYARRGARIGLLARGMDGLQATAKEVHELGGLALILSCDDRIESDHAVPASSLHQCEIAETAFHLQGDLDVEAEEIRKETDFGHEFGRELKLLVFPRLNRLRV